MNTPARALRITSHDEALAAAVRLAADWGPKAASLNPDRHWRNIRTHTLHDPLRGISRGRQSPAERGEPAAPWRDLRPE